MTRRHIHYEAAFEQFVRDRGWPYVAIDEAKRAVFSGAHIKSFDFLVYPDTDVHVLVDVKGKKLAEPGPRGGRSWQNWVNRDDVDGLQQWQKVFGQQYRATFVFAYWLTGQQRIEDETAFVFRDRRYMFLAVYLDEYIEVMRTRSQRWNTVAVPAKMFDTIAFDIATRWE